MGRPTVRRRVALGLVALPAVVGPASAWAATPAGLTIFRQAGCGGCHTLLAAGASGTTGPNLDQLAPSAATVAAQVRSGGGGMPSFTGTLGAVQIASLASWVAGVAGKGSPPTSTPAPATDLVQKHTAADTASARGLLLTLTDFGPGWTATAAAARQVALTCPGFEPRLPGVVETGAATSDNFQGSQKGPFVSVSSWVYGTAAQAASLWLRAVQPGLLRCFVGSVQQASTSLVKLTIRSKGRLALPKLAPRQAGSRIVATAEVKGQSVPAYYELIVLGAGRAVAELSFAQLAAPVSRSIELSLARTVAGRLRTVAGKGR